MEHEGQEWELVRPPFDATRALAFTGQGQFTRQGDRLLFVDARGARIARSLDDGVPSPPCA